MATQSIAPSWRHAWAELAPRLVMVAEGRYRLGERDFAALERQGFDCTRLRAWHPTLEQGRRIANLYYLTQHLRTGSAEKRPGRLQSLHSQLKGEDVWADLRRLALAYVDAGANEKLPGSRVPGAAAAAGAGKRRQTGSLPRWKARKVRVAKEKTRLIAELPRQDSLACQCAAPTEILAGASELTLYLDETWHGTETALRKNEGVIAGLLCRGAPGQELGGLARINTHVYERPGEMRQALEQLWRCQDCLPLIFRLGLPSDEPAGRYYDELLQHSLRLLLGWLLPPPEKPVRLHLCAEAIAPNHEEGSAATEYFRGLLAGDPLDRFDGWDLARVGWHDKNDAYIPYADLVAHLNLEHTELNRAVGDWVDFKSLPGYVPFSLKLVPLLERLEHLEAAANLDDVIAFALDDVRDSHFGRRVMAGIAARLAPRPDLQQRLLEALEGRYRDKVRDLAALRRAFAAVRELLPALPADASPRLRLLWYLLAFQDANHDGDPARIHDTAGAYWRERDRLLQSERELCAEADLNLAVHDADHFAFDHAEVIVSDWVFDPLFPALSLRQQGRMLSALGQYRAMLGEVEEADRCFARALECFAQAPLSAAERAGECDQTGIYRAINAIDGELPGWQQALMAVLGPITAASAARYATDDAIASQYRHHLLLRALTQRPELAEARAAYLAAADRWRAGHPQHPWPGIHGYRAFLLWNHAEGDAEARRRALRKSMAHFDLAIAAAAQPWHGPTIKLIGAFWATLASCCFAEPAFEVRARALLDQARVLPRAEFLVTALEEVLSAPDEGDIDDLLRLMPFNYR